jgi:preprotein translocase subunit SecG
MYTLLIFVELIVSALLMVAILMQSSKGGGLAGSFGGGNMGTVFGVRRTADFLSRATTILATVFIALALLINIFFLPGRQSADSIIQKGGAATTAPRPTAPTSSPVTAPPVGK